MASTAELLHLFVTTLLSAAVPVVLFVLLRKRGAEEGPAALFSGRRWPLQRRGRSSASTPPTTSMLLKVSPSAFGFLPDRVPCFSFDNALLDGIVAVSMA